MALTPDLPVIGVHSLSSVPTEDAARITVRQLGIGSSAISAVRPGTRVSLEGPYGVFTDTARTAPKLAIMVAGIGITPVRAFLEDARGGCRRLTPLEV